MIIDMNYWGKVLKNLLILALSVLGFYLGFKLVIFYMPFLVAFIISLLLEPCIYNEKNQTETKNEFYYNIHNCNNYNSGTFSVGINNISNRSI